MQVSRNQNTSLLLPKISLLDSIKRIKWQQTRYAAIHRSEPNSLSDDHSELVPLLPISNRTVKRLRANDSVDYPCESRSSSDSLQTAKPSSWGLCCFWHLIIDLLSLWQHAAQRPFELLRTGLLPHKGRYRLSMGCSPWKIVYGGVSYQLHRCDVKTKVGYRQSPYQQNTPRLSGVFCFCVPLMSRALGGWGVSQYWKYNDLYRF